MADSGAAQNKLGELFVDIGVGGLGKTLKALNSVSASFLLTKNAAVQVGGAILNIAKDSMKSSVEIGKLGASFGTTLVEAQKLSYYLKQYNLNEGLLSDLGGIQEKLTKAKMGYGSLDGQMLMSLNRLNLDWQKYDGSTESMLQLVKDVHTRVAQMGMTAQEAKVHLKNLGLNNPDWLYAFQRSDFNLDEALNINDDVIEKNIQAQEKWNKLQNKLNEATLDFSANLIDNGGLDKINKAINVVDGLTNAATPLNKDIKEMSPIGKSKSEAAKTMLLNAIPVVGAVRSFKVLKDTKDLWNSTDNLLNENPLPETNGINPGDNLSYNINITNENNINGSNADEIAEKIASINSQDIQMTQFQAHNMAGA